MVLLFANFCFSQTPIPQMDNITAYFNVDSLTGYNENESVTPLPDLVNSHDLTGIAGNLYKLNVLGEHEALLFNGTSQYLSNLTSLPAALAGEDIPMTIFWIVKENDLASHNCFWCLGVSSSSTIYHFARRLDSDSLLYVFRRSGSLKSDATINDLDTDWHMWVLVSGTKTSTLYKDAEIVIPAFDTDVGEIAANRFAFMARLTNTAGDFTSGYFHAGGVFNDSLGMEELNNLWRVFEPLGLYTLPQAESNSNIYSNNFTGFPEFPDFINDEAIQ